MLMYTNLPIEGENTHIHKKQQQQQQQKEEIKQR